jgi:hypothetical protein
MAGYYGDSLPITANSTARPPGSPRPRALERDGRWSAGEMRDTIPIPKSCCNRYAVLYLPTEIPVENIHGPILLLSGKDDQIWPGDMMADKLMARLKQHRHAYHGVHFSYDQVGHSIPCGYLPTAGDFSGLRLVIGGNAEGVAKAQRDNWPRVLGFLTQASSAVSP